MSRRRRSTWPARSGSSSSNLVSRSLAPIPDRAGQRPVGSFSWTCFGRWAGSRARRLLTPREHAVSVTDASPRSARESGEVNLCYRLQSGVGERDTTIFLTAEHHLDRAISMDRTCGDDASQTTRLCRKGHRTGDIASIEAGLTRTFGLCMSRPNRPMPSWTTQPTVTDR